MSVLFIVPYPEGRAPSQRFRVEQYFPILDNEGIQYKLSPFLDASAWDILYKGGAVWKKAHGVIKGFCKRIYTVLIVAPYYKTIFIHREAAPLGPPVFEWWLTKILRKKVVYDFDDAIWIPNISKENKLVVRLKAFGKIAKICKWATVIVPGNNYLRDFARDCGAKQIVVLPTVVDTVRKYKSGEMPGKNELAIGWTGSHSTIKYLNRIIPVIQRIQRELNVKFIVIADKDPQLPLANYEFIKWKPDTEITDLARLSIGVMPLERDAWSEGKCGFKLIQYMALGIPAIASPIGVNKLIINDGEDGFLVDTDEQWYEALKKTLDDTVRSKLGAAAIVKIRMQYSISTHQQNFLQLLD